MSHAPPHGYRPVGPRGVGPTFCDPASLPAQWDPKTATWHPLIPVQQPMFMGGTPLPMKRPTQLTDTQLGHHYADLWTAANSPLLDRVFQHIAHQEQRIKELQKS